MVKAFVVLLAFKGVFEGAPNNLCDKECSNCQTQPWECQNGQCSSGIEVNSICLKHCPYGFRSPCTFTSGVVLEETFSSFEFSEFQAGSDAST